MNKKASISLVSVIMPTLNSEKTIRLSLESTRKQSYDQNLIEILVIDGGSTDKTREIAREYNCRILENPIKILKLAKGWLKKNRVILVDVPNANSINRLVGVKMGLLERKTDLHENDIRIGHRRVYTLNKLIWDAKKAGLRIRKTGGIFFKPLSNKQIEENWDKQMIKGFYKLGKDFPELDAEIYIICSQ